MKARIQRTNASILLAHDTVAFAGRMKPMEAHVNSVARVKAQLLACSDEAAHIERVKLLKAQVDAGTYSVDSQALAQKMQSLPVMRPLPDNEKRDTLFTIDKDESYE